MILILFMAFSVSKGTLLILSREEKWHTMEFKLKKLMINLLIKTKVYYSINKKKIEKGCNTIFFLNRRINNLCQTIP